MASSNSSENTNQLKIARIGEIYLEKLRKKYGHISNHYDIRDHFKSIENQIWSRDSRLLNNTTSQLPEIRAFIDGLIKIIYYDIRYPLTQKQKQKRSRLKDANDEIENANKLAEKVTNLIQGKDDRNDETIGKAMEELEKKFGNGNSETFNNFVCCLLMSELEPKLPKSSNDEQVEIKANLFTGVFQSWNLLQKLGQVKDTELKEILFNEENKTPIIDSIVNRERKKKITYGFNKIIEFIEEFIKKYKNIRINDLDSFCKKEEDIQNSFYKWFIDSGVFEKKITDFAKCYVSVKTHPTNINHFKDHLQWEIDEVQKYFNFKTTENVSSLQKQLVDLWKQVKDNVNDVKKWKQFVIENSNKRTTHVVSCNLIDKLECLQINLNRSEEAWNQVVDQWLKDDRVHIVFIQEPCIKKMETRQDVCYYFPNLPTNYRAIHNTYLIDQELPNAGIFISAILVHEDVSFERILPMAPIHDNYNYPQELMAGIRLTGQGWNGVTLFSIYCRPIRSLTMVLQPLRLLLGNHDMTRTVLCMDANATHPSWSPDHENTGLYSGRGQDLEYFRTSCNLKVANKDFKNVKKENNQSPKDDRENKPEQKSKHIDVTFYRGDHLCIQNWKRLERLEDETLSDHRYITFSIRNNSEDAKKSSLHLSSLKSCLGRNQEVPMWRQVPLGVFFLNSLIFFFRLFYDWASDNVYL